MIRNYCIYKHTCPNGKVYIGITGGNPLDRWKSGKGYENNLHFYRAILKYGWDNIKHEILLDSLTQKEAAHYETELIAAYESTNPQFGYNISCGGEIGRKGIKQSKESYVQAWETRRRNGNDIPWNKGISTGGNAVAQYDKHGNYIAVYQSARQAACMTGISCGHISECCNGKRKTAGKFVWKRNI